MPNPYTASGAPRNPQVSLVDALLGAEALRRLKGAGSSVAQNASKMRMAASPAIMGTLRTTGRVVPYAAGITGILTALEELEDDRLGESREKNIADFSGRAGGSLLGTVLGGGLGALTGPAAPIAVPAFAAAGSYLGGIGGRAVGGGLYNLFNDPKANEANFYNTANQAVINSQAMNNNLMNNIQGLL
jgi:phage tail tape-measure protein